MPTDQGDFENLPAARDFRKVPVNRRFGFSLLSLGGGFAEVTMPVEHSFVQEEGVVHGGVLGTLADTAAVYTIYPFLDDGETMSSIEFKLNFLRPVFIDDGLVTAKAKLVRRGSRVALSHVEVFQAQRLVATGSFTYLVYRRAGEEG